MDKWSQLTIIVQQKVLNYKECSKKKFNVESDNDNSIITFLAYQTSAWLDPISQQHDKSRWYQL